MAWFTKLTQSLLLTWTNVCLIYTCIYTFTQFLVQCLICQLLTSGIIQLNVSWTPPSEPNGVIIVYEVCTNSSGVFSYTNTSATQHTLRDLPPNTVVAFSVRAYTIIGPGEYVTGQASTESIRKHTEHHCSAYFEHSSFLFTLIFSTSKCQRTVIRCSQQHISENLLDCSHPDSGGPLHCTLHWHG